MRHLYLILLISSASFAQTVQERNEIKSSYDQAVITKLFNDVKAQEADQKQKIENYKKTHLIVDSETKSLQRIYDGIPIFFTIFNANSSVTIGANSMYPGGALGLNVTGAGMVAGVWDGSKVRETHLEIAGKATPSDAAVGLSSHATHVTGTIIASGVSTIRRGIAYGGLAHTYDWTSDISEMTAFGAEGYLVSNHSYGYNTENLPVSAFGTYDGSSVQIDQVSNSFPFYQIVVAAGNDRSNTALEQVNNKGGYDMTTGFGNAKNGITVAAVEQVLNYVNASSVVMSSFSNYGPTDDGRIKPDISAKGVDVSSCGNLTNSQYSVLSGTSMASPAITGLVLMLQKHYNNLNSSFMRASTVKGLICHSAKEAGLATGPDYEFGWGLADGQAAATIITGKGVTSILEENTLAVGQTFTKQVAISAPQMLTATICWTDPTGTASSAEDNRTARLKNNLDLKIIKDGVTYYPWRLDVEQPTLAATRIEDNNVDNVEKVQIDLAQPGTYTIQVTHKGANLVGGSQVFSLIASAPSGVTLASQQFGFEGNVVLYPNPANDVISIATPNNTEISSIEIIDVLGKSVAAHKNILDNKVDVSLLSNGVYFAKFDFNGQILVKRFIKE